MSVAPHKITTLLNGPVLVQADIKRPVLQHTGHCIQAPGSKNWFRHLLQRLPARDFENGSLRHALRDSPSAPQLPRPAYRLHMSHLLSPASL